MATGPGAQPAVLVMVSTVVKSSASIGENPTALVADPRLRDWHIAAEGWQRD
jgi:hypothetical protein